MTDGSGYYLGRATSVSTNYFAGVIDEFRVYNRILNENEIQCLSEKYACIFI